MSQKKHIFAPAMKTKEKDIPVIKFARHKYGGELLVDVVTLDDIRRSPQFASVLRQSFYGIMLTTGGEGDVEVDGQPYIAVKGTVACARPGDVCKVVDDRGLKSLQLIFERNFLLSFFNDAHFLDGIPCLSPQRLTPYLQLDNPLYNRIAGLYDSILIELHSFGEKDHHLLRAMLYEVLTLLKKDAVLSPKVTRSDRIARFRYLVEEHFLTENSVDFYADKLCITPNYLNRLVEAALGQSTKQYIQCRRIEEAQRLLRYTSLPVTDIAERLGFDTASYFVRVFFHHTSSTPLQYRQQQGF